MEAYYIFDKISPKLRNLLTILIFFTGFALQLNSRNILVGLPFIIFCVIMNFVKNFSIKPIRAQKLEWKEVTPERIEHVYKHCQRLAKAEGSNIGCIILFLSVIFLITFGIPLLDFFGNLILRNSESTFAIIAILIDSIIVFGGLSLSGRRSVWIPNSLDIKIPIIKRILNHPVFSKDPNIKIIPYLEIGETKEGQFPNDARILIKFKDAPQDFIGLQFQTSINDVQGRKYPYCYCVIVAKKAFALLSRFIPVKLSRITIENEISNEVDVLIIRQTTTKNSGYHTNDSAQDYILSSGIDIAKKILSTFAPY